MLFFLFQFFRDQRQESLQNRIVRGAARVIDPEAEPGQIRDRDVAKPAFPAFRNVWVQGKSDPGAGQGEGAFDALGEVSALRRKGCDQLALGGEHGVGDVPGRAADEAYLRLVSGKLPEGQGFVLSCKGEC